MEEMVIKWLQDIDPQDLEKVVVMESIKSDSDSALSVLSLNDITFESEAGDAA